MLTEAGIVDSTVPVPCPRQYLSALKAHEWREGVEPYAAMSGVVTPKDEIG